ncbi:hypothetical protein [Sorangium sp. So ce1151]|uniref:hypothetical protein n=1 Tax=Sorangium sp. So ce1151 TaxID=3133332 RepID=UPI003F5F2712
MRLAPRARARDAAASPVPVASPVPAGAISRGAPARWTSRRHAIALTPAHTRLTPGRCSTSRWGQTRTRASGASSLQTAKAVGGMATG